MPSQSYNEQAEGGTVILAQTTGLEERIRDVRDRMARAAERSGRRPDDITLVAVTKGADPPSIRRTFNAGVRHFGENRVQDALYKVHELRSLTGATWRMIGHLQSNKVKPALEVFDAFDTVDSVRLAMVLNEKAGRRLPVLMEVNASGEASKSGFRKLQVFGAAEEIRSLPNLDLRGLMTVEPAVKQTPEELRSFFREMRRMKEQLGLAQLSMGMSDDFEVAIEEGATFVRIGRAIFGNRKE